MFENFAKLDSPRRLVQFWKNLQTSLVLLIPNCTRQRMITYTKGPVIIYGRGGGGGGEDNFSFTIFLN